MLAATALGGIVLGKTGAAVMAATPDADVTTTCGSASVRDRAGPSSRCGLDSAARDATTVASAVRAAATRAAATRAAATRGAADFLSDDVSDALPDAITGAAEATAEFSAAATTLSDLSPTGTGSRTDAASVRSSSAARDPCIDTQLAETTPNTAAAARPE